MRIGLRVIPRRDDTRSLKECDEWAASTDSRKLRLSAEIEGIERGVGFAPLRFICSRSYSTIVNAQGVNKTHLLSAMAFHCNKYTPSTRIRVFGIDREIWAPNDPDFYLSVDDE
jgi:hypothetical protein